MVLSPVGAIGGDATAMLITGSRTVRGTQWVRILLPKRPNGRQAWIRADHARIVRRRTRIEINRARRVLTLFRGRRAIVRTKVAIGRNGTPTPRGMHAVAEVVNTYSPGSYLGPRVLVLSAHSETINYFRGGRGRVAIHGTDRPQLLGTQASLGCIRVGNANILRLARLAPPGTPVRVR
jgi:lipoprotein-anchoring transpeptidase ErfK/SrfK